MAGKEGESTGQFTTQHKPQESGSPKEERTVGNQLAALMEQDVLEKLRHTPKGEDPAFWPIRVLNELEYYISIKNDPSVSSNTRAIGQKYASYEETIHHVKTAYSILAHPRCQYQGWKEQIETQLELNRQSFGQDQVELNDQELKILSRLTAARDIPFNHEKRVYSYSEVPISPWIDPYGRRHMTTEEIREWQASPRTSSPTPLYSGLLQTREEEITGQLTTQTATRSTEKGQTREGGVINTPLVFYMKQEVIDKLNPASSAEAKASQSIEIMSNLQYLIAMRQYKTGQDKAVGEKLAPYKDSIQRLGMAYDIIAYPLLEETRDGLAIREAIRDAQEFPNKDTQEYPHRTPFKLNEEEIEILGQLTRTIGLPFDPKKQIYSYTELSARRDAYNQAAMNSYMARKARQNAIDAGMVRKRSDIEKEIRQRRIRPLPSEIKPSDPKK